MCDYAEIVSRLRINEKFFNERDAINIATLYRDAADAIEELLARACPHYHRNVHDRGDDSYCDVLNREVPKGVE